MMAVEFVDATEDVTDGGSNSFTVDAVPVAVADDLCLAFSAMHNSADPVIQWDADLTEIDGGLVTSGADKIAGFARRAVTGSEPADFTVINGNGQSGTEHYFSIACFRGVNLSDPIQDISMSLGSALTGDVNLPFPALTGSNGGMLVRAVFMGCNSAGAGTIDDFDTMLSIGQGEQASTAGGFSFAGWAREELVADGDTAEHTWVVSRNPHGFYYILSATLRPADPDNPDPGDPTGIVSGKSLADQMMAFYSRENALAEEG